jgi:hypothetical protein
MIAKLVNAGYLQPERQHDANAITSAILKMKGDLRSGRGQNNGLPASQPATIPTTTITSMLWLDVPPPKRLALQHLASSGP